jgi:hypothetical protein
MIEMMGGILQPLCELRRPNGRFGTAGIAAGTTAGVMRTPPGANHSTGISQKTRGGNLRRLANQKPIRWILARRKGPATTTILGRALRNWSATARHYPHLAATVLRLFPDEWQKDWFLPCCAGGSIKTKHIEYCISPPSCPPTRLRFQPGMFVPSAFLRRLRSRGASNETQIESG